MLSVLALLSVSQSADIYLFSIALQPIKSEFHLTDTELGTINGLAFALFFGVAGVPIARLAERRGRRLVIVASVAIWSLFTAATAFASGFASLFITRVFVGVGQSGCKPAAQSFIAERFPPERRSGAMSVLYAGDFVGLMLGLALGGVLISTLGWRGAFFTMGASGMLLAPLAWLTLREPARSLPPASTTLRADVAAIVRRPAFLHLTGLLCVYSFVFSGTLAWAPAFYARYYHMDPARAGEWLSLAVGGGSLLGTLIGGFIANRLSRVSQDAGLRFSLWVFLVYTPLIMAVFLIDGRLTSLGVLLISMIVGCLPTGPVFAVLHDLVEPRHRATAVAVSYLAMIVLGQGLGPVFVGAVSDWAGIFTSHDTLRVALIAINVLNIWGLLHAYALLRAYQRQLRDTRFPIANGQHAYSTVAARTESA